MTGSDGKGPSGPKTTLGKTAAGKTAAGKTAAGKTTLGKAGGTRKAAVRVRKAKKMSLSSKLWLERQLNDPYVAEAQRLGFRSRAAFKLLQLDDRFHFLQPGRIVIDLGAAPGGWTQVAADRVKQPRGLVVGLDYLAMEPVPGTVFLQMDFLDPGAPAALMAELAAHAAGRKQADVVLSDMAAPTTGHNATDHLRIIGLAETAYHFAAEILAPGGAFVAKVFQGGSERELLSRLKQDFTEVRHVKPPASRTGSAEMYVVATGFRGGG